MQVPSFPQRIVWRLFGLDADDIASLREESRETIRELRELTGLGVPVSSDEVQSVDHKRHRRYHI